MARRSDIDMNGHINNVTYLAWTQETVPLDTFLNYKLHQVRGVRCLLPDVQCGFPRDLMCSCCMLAVSCAPPSRQLHCWQP